MICKIADLIVEVPAAGDLVSRCAGYITKNATPDIVIPFDNMDAESTGYTTDDIAAYMESGRWFYAFLLDYGGILLHSSAVEVDGKAYLFSGPCGAGKSTHTRLYKQIFGDNACVFNDDKPALRKIEGKWYAYGTPWCGKDGINENMRVPLAGICFLEKGRENTIRRLSNEEAVNNIISQTMRQFSRIDTLDKMITTVDQLLRDIPVYELINRPEQEAAKLSYETMLKGAEEQGL